jgi:hypothetical protein
MTDDQAAADAETRRLLYDKISMRYGTRVWEAIERRHELGQRSALARAEAELKASSRWDPARFGPGGREPLTAAEHLEVVALGEYISRHYQPHGALDEALRAGATLEQVAGALGCREDETRERIRSWAQGQNRLSREPGLEKFGMSDNAYAAVLGRLEAGLETCPGGIGDPANIGIRSDREAG